MSDLHELVTKLREALEEEKATIEAQITAIVAARPPPAPKAEMSRAVITLSSEADFIANSGLGNNMYMLTQDVTVTTFPGFYLDNPVTTCIFDGNGYTITILNRTDFAGLFIANVSSNINQITVQNLTITASNSTLAQNAGWFFTADSTGTAINCGSNGPIQNPNCGGIFGRAGEYGTNNTITVRAENCYSTGIISGTGAGGIVGGDSIQGTDGQIKNCYSTGPIIGNNAGGIIGTNAVFRGFVTIENCYSLGNMSGVKNGGIVGSNVAYQGTVVITNCYSVGDMSDSTSGGIIAASTSPPGVITIQHCFTTGSGGNSIYGPLDNITPTVTNSGHNSGWADSAANMYLTGFPGEDPQIWYSWDIDTPYRLTAPPAPPYPLNSFLLLTDDSVMAVSGNVLLYSADSVITFFETDSFGADPTSYPPGSLFRRTGRRLTKPHEYVFSEVQLIACATNGGRGGPTGYVCSWAASGSPPGLA